MTSTATDDGRQVAKHVCGHSMLCPYHCKGKERCRVEKLGDPPLQSKSADREIGVSRLVRGARPGKPGRQTAGASSRTPQEVPECARQMVDK